jgi:hypothetical protein
VKRVIGAACAVAALLVGTREAFAAPHGERVIVVAGADEQGAARLSEELASLSFDAKRVVAEDPSAPCDPIGIFSSALEAGAVAAVCIDHDAIRIWIGAERGAVRESIPRRDAAGGERTLVEVQAVEILRASLRTGPDAPVPLAAERAAPVFEVVESASATAMNIEADRAPKREVGLRDGYRTARLAIAAGPGFIVSEGDPVAIADVRATIGIARWVSFAPRLVIPLASDSVLVNNTTSYGSATMRPALAGIGLSMPLTRATSTFSAEVGGGTALVWMHVSPTVGLGELTTTRSEDLFAPAAYADASASIGLSSHVRLGLGASVGATAGRFVVRMGGTRTHNWGTPFADATLRATWMLP